MHQAYLSLGSNIQPEVNLTRAIELLQQHGRVLTVSSAWESEAVGSDGPNFLNACVQFSSPHSYSELREQVAHSIEAMLGRKRSVDKYAPRTIDIDIVLFEDKLCDDKFWKQAFVIVPLAEICPEYQNPFTGESIIDAASHLRQSVWMNKRSEVLRQFGGNNTKP